MEEEMCLVDSYTTNTILGEVKIFQSLTKCGQILIVGSDSSYHQVFSYKVFNETMIDASICLISCFPHSFFSRDKTRHELLLKCYRFMIEQSPALLLHLE